MRITLIALGLLWVPLIAAASWKAVPTDRTRLTHSKVSFAHAQASPHQDTGSRKVLGAWLFAITGTAVVLRSRRSRTL
jgi:hypothetical protein